MDSRSWRDIAYNFAFDQLGNCYEGRGWGIQGAHTEGFNSVGHAFEMTHDSNVEPPSDACIRAMTEKAFEGISLGYLRSDVQIVGHRDVLSTDCPGQSLYNRIPEIRQLNSIEEDMTPEQAATLEALKGPFNVDVVESSTGIWYGVGVGSTLPNKKLSNVPATVGWAVEGATASRVILDRLTKIEAQLAKLGPVASPVDTDKVAEGVWQRFKNAISR